MNESVLPALPAWPRAFGSPAARGRLRSRPADFVVHEEIDIELSGAGEHDWLLVEKTGVNTAWLARQLARFAGCAARDVGYAGLKDRHAVTRQWFSVHCKDVDWTAFELDGVCVLEQTRHARKLRRGAHRANRFEICIRELSGDPSASLARVAAEGVPNYFGEQRFGHDGRNLELATALFAGRRLPRDKRSLALSAARAALFNAVLAARVGDGTWNRLVDGDVVALHGSRSTFVAEQIDDELQARCSGFDLHPTGPLWGREKTPGRQREEQALLGDWTEMAAALESQVDADRRPLRLRPEGFDAQLDGGVLRVAFSLPPGSFATAVLREIVDYVDEAAIGASVRP